MYSSLTIKSGHTSVIFYNIYIYDYNYYRFEYNLNQICPKGRLLYNRGLSDWAVHVVLQGDLHTPLRNFLPAGLSNEVDKYNHIGRAVHS